MSIHTEVLLSHIETVLGGNVRKQVHKVVAGDGDIRDMNPTAMSQARKLLADVKALAGEGDGLWHAAVQMIEGLRPAR